MATSPLLLGHRGTRVVRSTPENTLAAFDTALDQGCDGFEFDVRATSDGHAVVVHDPKVRGVTVAKVKLDRLRGLPKLAEVLQKFGSRGFLDIELKVKGLESMVLQLLRDYPPVRGFVLSSFLPAVVIELRARRSALPLGVICDKAAQLRRASDLPVDFMILEQELVSEDVVQEIHAAGRKLLVWTVNKPDTMHRLASWGVDGIISDDPALLVSSLSASRAKSEMPPSKAAKGASSKGAARSGKKGRA